MLEVGELYQLDYGTTSTEQGDCPLRGILSVISEEKDPHGYEQGTIILQDDQDIRYSLLCVVDRYLPQLNNLPVYVRKWNYIYDEARDSRYLEFVMDSVILSLSQQQSFLRDKITEDTLYLERLLTRQQDTIIYTPNHTIPPTVKDDINIAGKVKAISALYNQPGTESRFFLQLATDKEEQDEKCIEILFSGNNIVKYYRYFKIGCFYAFQHLKSFKLKTAQQQQQQQQIVYLYQDTPSTCRMISPSIYINGLKPRSSTTNLIEYPTSSAAAAAAKKPTKFGKEKLSTYRGTITRLVDEVFNIYELDNQFQLSLFNFVDKPFYDLPIRCGTKITISQFHTADIITKQEDEPSMLLHQLWNTCSNMFFVACAKTRLELVSIPKDDCDPPPFLEGDDCSLKMKISRDLFERHATFSQFMRQMEIYAVLKFNFPGLVSNKAFMQAFEGIRNHIFQLTRTRGERSCGDFENDFLFHEKVCSAIGSEYSRKDKFVVTLETFLDLDQVKSLLMDQLQDYKLDIAGGNSMFEEGLVQVKMASLEDHESDYCVIGMVDFLADGRLYLFSGDSNNKKKILLSTTVQGLKLGSIYIVRRAQLFQEDLSYMDDDDDISTKHTLDMTYLCCDAQDLIPTRRSSDLQFYMKHPGQGLNAALVFITNNHGIELMDGLQAYMVGYVENMEPTKTRPNNDKKKKGTNSLGSGMTVILYKLGQKTDEFIEPESYQVIMDSTRGSLKFSKQVEVGQWYIFAKISPQALTSIPATSISPRRPQLYLDASVVIYPIHFDQDQINENTVTMVPVLSKKRVQFDDKDPTRKIYSVKEFLLIDDTAHPKLQKKGQNSLFTHPLHVRGIVVTKKFVDGWDKTTMTEKDALQLYQELGVGTGKARRKLFLQLRQHDGLEVFNVYSYLDKLEYHIGLIPGATVTFGNLERRTTKAGGLYFNANENTTIHVECTLPPPGVQSLPIGHMERRYLSSFRKQDGSLKVKLEDTVVKLCCQVTSIITLQLKYECKDCRSIVRDNECFGQCKNASRILVASAFVQIDDGTACANANVDGERLVFRLLRIGPNQEESMYKLVSKYGEISYIGWKQSTVSTALGEDIDDISLNDLTIEDICKRAKEAGIIYIYARLQKDTAKKRKRGAVWDDDVEEKKYYQDGTEYVDITEKHGLKPFTVSDKGNLMKTMEQAKFKVKVLEIEAVDHALLAYQTLLKMEQQQQPQPHFQRQLVQIRQQQ